ncbi:hypothetical protein RJ639_022860 [Escallonia herrerae]|uniref:RING-type E3 ubiquitin transferase n=1 Tax=Escallonia herrerae TaxID=1293975 RepID=A0AA88V2J1_9ASTE|nr:hypothetical protein RJ639_025508 [Escallonia herrerae]KAK2999874.1 hypothetical protein RJ639_022860 [Escallonia herrerae]
MNQSRFELGHGITRAILFIFLLLFPPHTTAQTETGTPPPPPPGYPYASKIKVSPSTAIVLVCVITAFFVLGCLSIFARQCTDRFALSAINDPGGGGGLLRRMATARGLDAEVIDTFPMFLYAEVKGLKIGKGALECAVCLNEFEEAETLRLLPSCSHVFHPDCIDAWLASHVTCPVCRSNLVPGPDDARRNFIPCHNLGNGSDIHDSGQSSEELVIDMDPPQTTRTTNRNRPPRAGESKGRITGKFPRSHSTGHSLVQPGQDCERFTLRLPEDVRSQLVNTSLSRSRSYVAFPRARSSRKGFRSSSAGSNRGKNYGSYERFDQEEGSNRLRLNMPPFFSRARSVRSFKMGVGDVMTASPKRKFVSVMFPPDRVFGETDHDYIGERSFDKLRSIS